MPDLFRRRRQWEFFLSSIGVVAAALALAGALYLSRSIEGALSELQEQANEARVDSLLRALEQNVEYLGDFTTGYSMWDETYDYLRQPEPAYIERNYSLASMRVTPLQLVALYDLQGRLAFAVAYTEDYQAITPPDGLKELPELENFAGLKKAGEYLGRVEWMEDHAYVMTVCPVTNSDGTAPVRGYLLFGSVMGRKYIEKLEKLTGLKLKANPQAEPLKDAREMPLTRLGTAEVAIARKGEAQQARIVFPEHNTRQTPVRLDVQLPNREGKIGRNLGRLVVTVLLLIAAAFVAFVVLSARNTRTRRDELQRRRVDRRRLIEARRSAIKLAGKATAAERAKSAFLAMMSHEIRTPLNAIIGYTDLLKAEPGDPQIGHKLEIIGESGVMLRHILDDILDYSKIEAGELRMERKPTDIRHAIGTLAETFRAPAQARGNRIEAVFDEAVPEGLRLDEIRVKQVVGNLLSNAVKFTENGLIEVRADMIPGPMLRLRVRDSGVGISPEDEAKLFQPFTQSDDSTTRKFEGTGLGLAICRKLCALMDGNIRFQRRVEGGSEFVVELPAEKAARPETGTTPAAMPEGGVKTLRILAVDDRAVNCRLLNLVLQKFGGRAHLTASGEEAVEWTRREPADLVFMDIHMPGIGGHEAARQIRRIERSRGWPRCYMVALTADTLVTDEIDEEEFDMFLAKPFRPEDIGQILASAARRKETV